MAPAESSPAPEDEPISKEGAPPPEQGAPSSEQDKQIPPENPPVSEQQGAPISNESKLLAAAGAPIPREGPPPRLTVDLRGTNRVTIALTAACVALFALTYLFDGDGFDSALWALGADSGAAVRRGEVYRLLASAFLHANAPHIFVNMIALWSFGVPLERVLGSRRYLVLYAASALGGSLASSLLGPHWSVGASGAIWGLMTAGVAIAVRPRGLLPQATIAVMRKRVAGPLIINLLYSLQPGVDMLAHIGGGVVGFAVTITFLTRGLTPLDQREDPRVPEPSPSRGFLAAAVISGSAMAISVVAAILLGRPWELGQEPVLVPTPIASAGVVVSLPARVARNMTIEDQEGVQYSHYGMIPDTPLEIEITGGEQPILTTPEAKDEYLTQVLKNAERNIETSDRWKAPPARVTVGGHPAIRFELKPSNGIVTVTYLVTLDRHEVLIRTGSIEDRPRSWADIEAKVAATAREQ